MRTSLTICTDYDGTLVTNDFPAVGRDIGGFAVIKALQEAGHKVILFTVRSDQKLQEALDFASKYGVTFDHVNENPEQKEFSTSPKVFCDLYIDDMALGAPLKTTPGVEKPYIDWSKVIAMLKSMDVL